MERIRVWEVDVDGRKALLDDLDVALAYLRADLGTNGALKASLESRSMTRAEYVAAVELEEGGAANG